MTVLSAHREAIALTTISLIATAIWATVAWLLIQWRHEARQRATWRANRASRAGAHRAVHEGATEAYGPELRAAGRALPSADLRTTGEQMVADHQELDGIGAALDQFGEAIDHHLRQFCRSLPGDQQLRLARWGGSTVADTGTFNRRDLDRALAGSVAR